MPEITKCRICDSQNLIPYLDLGQQPWCNDFLTEDRVGKEKYYPLEVVLCENCKASQLSYNVPKETMFSDHTYVSGTTSTLRKHFAELAKYTKEQYNLQENDFIVDIGGNDGTHLMEYQKIGLKNVVNVESASNICKISEKNMVPTLEAFFDNATADDLISDNGHAKVILASGVFFHLEDLHSVCRGIKSLLDDDGVFVVQFMYFKSIIDKMNFDSIYHEHLLYYTISSIKYLLNMYDLHIDNLFYSGIHGGSMMMYCTKKKKESDDLNSFIKGIEMDLNDIRTYQTFAFRVNNYKTKLYNVLGNLRVEGIPIHAYGAPAKGNTLLNYVFGKDGSSMIKMVEEANPLKFDRYMPNTHIPIVDYRMVEDRPDYYLVLAWNFLSEFLSREVRYLEDGGHFIVPFPYEPFIIDRNNYKQFV